MLMFVSYEIVLDKTGKSGKEYGNNPIHCNILT